MEYVRIEEAGTITFQCDSAFPTINNINGLNNALQKAIYKLIYKTVINQNLQDRFIGMIPESTDKSSKASNKILESLRANIFFRIQKIHIGSIYEEIIFYATPVLANSDVRAVLAGLASNFIYAIASSRLHRLRMNRISITPWYFTKQNKVKTEPPMAQPGIPNFAVNIKEVIESFAEKGVQGRVTFSSKSAKGDSMEINFEFHAYDTDA